jgi:hypothetical protein
VILNDIEQRSWDWTAGAQLYITSIYVYKDTQIIILRTYQMTPNVAVKWSTLPLYIREVPASNLSTEACQPEFRGYPRAQAAPFHNISNPFTNSLMIRRYITEATDSVVK